MSQAGRPQITAIGLNHRTAPVDVRDRAAVREGELTDILGDVLFQHGADEAVVLSTCNRFEVYVAAHGSETPPAFERFLSARCGLTPARARPYLYTLRAEDAVRHLFLVTCSLDSMVVGERQITAQVRDAYARSAECGATGPLLHRLFQHALRTARLVWKQTALGHGRLSVGSVAVRLAKGILGRLSDKRVLLIGAGDMAEHALRTIVKNGATDVVVANRSLKRARALAARHRGKAIPFDEIAAAMSHCDIVISSTSAPSVVVRADDVAAALAGRKQGLLLIDIAMPRDIDPAAASVPGAHLYDIDHLQSAAAEEGAGLDQEAARAREIVEGEIASFMNWLGAQDAVDIIGDLREWAAGIARAEAARVERKDPSLTADQRGAVERMAERIVNKLIHPPIASLRGANDGPLSHRQIELVRRIFGLAQGKQSTQLEAGPERKKSSR